MHLKWTICCEQLKTCFSTHLKQHFYFFWIWIVAIVIASVFCRHHVHRRCAQPDVQERSQQTNQRSWRHSAGRCKHLSPGQLHRYNCWLHVQSPWKLRSNQTRPQQPGSNQTGNVDWVDFSSLVEPIKEQNPAHRTRVIHWFAWTKGSVSELQRAGYSLTECVPH